MLSRSTSIVARPAGRLIVRAAGLAAVRAVHTVPAERPQNVGILAMDVYFPQRCVAQKDLEVADGVSEGKYRIGLGQERMAYVGDREDVNSIAMSAVHNLLSKYNIDPALVGRLEVGTETLVDKSKSTKTHIMELFGSNTNVEGVTSINACYGGTAAILNSLAWIESSAWDGRYAVVVCGDIATYAAGPARPTGGCGAVAMLIGPDAPLPISTARHSHAEHCWDFYKPEMHSEYPAVDGHLSNTIYLRSVDVCYGNFLDKTTPAGSTRKTFDYLCFHSPYNKLVVKSVGRLLYNDFVRNPTTCDPALSSALAQWHPDSVSPSTTYADRGLDTALKKASAEVYNAMCAPSAQLSKEIGNSYTGALWMNLVSLVSNVRADLVGKNVFMFSYGSGSLATAFSIMARVPSAAQKPQFSCQAIAETIDLHARLSARTEMSPAEFTAALLLRETSHGAAPYAPTEAAETVTPGAFYIDEINSAHHRIYVQRPLADEVR
ncbi:hydroxymethylglutaryl-CoA synthase [Pavlovales sp. CCMP2436]|nr:hydroxymethylglutaryl-CoA synthase [Pavlovales sp. CCMP2436]